MHLSSDTDALVDGAEELFPVARSRRQGAASRAFLLRRFLPATLLVVATLLGLLLFADRPSRHSLEQSHLGAGTVQLRATKPSSENARNESRAEDDTHSDENSRSSKPKHHHHAEDDDRRAEVGSSHSSRSHENHSHSDASSKVISQCTILDNIFLPGNDILRVPYVTSAERCCERCRHHQRCLAWSWGKSGSGLDSEVCILKGATPRALTKVVTVGYVSGETHQSDKDGYPLSVRFARPGQSLYCFALVQPHGYESGLVAMQYEEQAGIFTCDEYAVYSNRRLELAPGVITGIVNSTLKCPMGGEFGTALNTGIFLALWAKVIQDARFVFHDWILKADPDTVFFADRLLTHVAPLEETPEGVYLNNCQFGLHGPLEVFSRNAVKNWALGAGDCVEYFTNLCSGPCGWGEDMFIDQCLLRKLKAKRVNDYGILIEAHCDPPKGWDNCDNQSAVAFHPFKAEEDWRACLANSRAGTTIFRK